MIYAVDGLTSRSPADLGQQISKAITIWQDQGMRIEIQTHVTAAHRGAAAFSYPEYSAFIIVYKPYD